MIIEPPPFRHYLPTIWAKSRQGSQPEGESLEEHSWNTVSRMADLARLRPALPNECGQPRLWHCLFWACLMHDFGKTASGFQAMLHDSKNNIWRLRHEVLSLAFVDWLFPTGDDRLWVVAAVASHHRDLAEIKDYIRDQQALERMVSEVDDSSVEGIYRWLSEGVPSWIERLGLDKYGVTMPLLPSHDVVTNFSTDRPSHIKAALQDYWDWASPPLMKKRPTLAQVIPAILMRGYIMQSDHTASAHTPPLPQLQISTSQLVEVWQRRNLPASLSDYNVHQQKSAVQIGSALLTAPTGSGKTEAAMLWAACQAENGTMPRIFYTLPYQASMNAMHTRLKEIFPDAHTADGNYEMVGIQHGRSLLALYRRLLEKYGKQSDHAGDTKKAEREARWLKNLAKLNYPPVRVFSPYQMLKGFYRLKGYESILADYYDAAFIFDEIHAYEVKRLALILKSVEFLAMQFHARFLFMSATFPTLIRERLKQALGEELPTIEANSKLFEEYRRHILRLRDGELTAPSVLAEIIAKVQAGGSVLVCVNTVQRAQEIYDALSPQVAAHNGKSVLLHGRFNGRDRLDKEKIINDAVGSKSAARQPLLVVATQAIEVSLDIDLEVIYTDPAPLEALVQRFGRINRRRLMQGLAEVFVFREPSDGQGIYNPDIVAATLKIVAREQDEPIDESKIGGWLDEIYVGKVREEWEAEYEKTAAEYENAIVAQLQPFAAADDHLEAQFDELFDGTEILPVCFEDEYNQAEAAGSIAAATLLVPISFGQYMMMKKKNGIRERRGGEKEWPRVAEVSYSKEYGLLPDSEEYEP